MFTGILPENFIASVTTIMVDLINSLSPVIILIISILAVGIILEIILKSHK